MCKNNFYYSLIIGLDCRVGVVDNLLLQVKELEIEPCALRGAYSGWVTIWVTPPPWVIKNYGTTGEGVSGSLSWKLETFPIYALES